MSQQTIVTIVGRVVSNVDLRSFGDGTYRANFRVSSTERRRDWRTGEWTDGETLYLSVTCWRGLAENVKASLQVGDPVMVRGKLSTRQYEIDGRKTSSLEMEASSVGPNLMFCTTAVTRTRSTATARAAEAVAAAVVEADAASPQVPSQQRGPDAPRLVTAGVGGEAAGEG